MTIKMTNCKPYIRWITLIFALHHINESDAFQRFAETPKYTEVNPGQDVLMTCKIIDKRGSCSWQKDNKPVGIYSKKYEWAGTSFHLQGIQSPLIGGDCSLWVRSASLDFDDGQWECQVTSSDFATQDALTSQPVRLVVRVAPQMPRLEYMGTDLLPGNNITVNTKSLVTVKCVSHVGNPPAMLQWFLDDSPIEPISQQVNMSEPDNPRTWSAMSVVQIQTNRNRHGQMLRCEASHESYATKERMQSIEARLNVKYAPSIRLLGAPNIDVREGNESVVLHCKADANPPADIVWRRAGRSEIASLQETLQLRPVLRRDSGVYTCQATNTIGTSEQLTVQVNVRYPPKILSAGPNRLYTVPLFGQSAMECFAEGNPVPTYKWIQIILAGSTMVERGRESRLLMDNITYEHQGEYECRATNFINGQEFTVSSKRISLQVVGAPKILTASESSSLTVRKGDTATLSLVVCADPRPKTVAWEWGSMRLEVGADSERYRVDNIVQDTREDCYLASMHISNTESFDSRPYYLVVENDRGLDRHAFHLNVEDPLTLSYMMGIVIGCMASIFFLACLLTYMVRRRKCCQGRQTTITQTRVVEKFNMETRSSNRSNSTQMAEYINTTPRGNAARNAATSEISVSPLFSSTRMSSSLSKQLQYQQHHQQSHSSPEAMKVRMAAMVLQPPTMV